MLQKSRVSDAYTSVGGLDKQIVQIRDLLEIPLTRPDMFRHFGMLLPFPFSHCMDFLTYIDLQG